MIVSKDEIIKRAIELSPMEKANLIELLLSSFNFQGRKEIDAAWAVEAEARLKAIENGEMETLSMEDVFSSLTR